mmetsp:Transcript_4452/g.3445  ORF Transcript_4452/g.3445 Transcript_4452/m.3445 type:complete len:96 (+) Transcript_4452:500-787(+)
MSSGGSLQQKLMEIISNSMCLQVLWPDSEPVLEPKWLRTLSQNGYGIRPSPPNGMTMFFFFFFFFHCLSQIPDLVYSCSAICSAGSLLLTFAALP